MCEINYTHGYRGRTIWEGVPTIHARKYIVTAPCQTNRQTDARVASKHQQRLGKIEEETEKTNQEKRVATAAAVSQYLLPLTRNNEELVGVEL